MGIEIKTNDRPFKSIQKIENATLPDFAVVTGYNGSGKSHLLEAIATGHISTGIYFQEIALFTNADFYLKPPSNNKQNSMIASPSTGYYRKTLEEFYQNLAKNLDGLYDIQDLRIFETIILGSLTENEHIRIFLTAPDQKLYIDGKFSETVLIDFIITNGPHTGLSNNFMQAYKEKYGNTTISQAMDIFRRYSIDADKLFRDYSADDYLFFKRGLRDGDTIFALQTQSFTTDSLYETEIIEVEKQYQLNYLLNAMNGVLKQNGKPVQFLKDDEFKLKYGNRPISVINEILHRYSCNKYQFKETDIVAQDVFYKGINQITMPLLLVDSTGKIVSLTELSSGEKILMALVLRLYKMEKHLSARVLLLDEVDASLHPSMTNQFLHIIKDIFVEQMKLKIILVTHSPTTVALSPEDKVFILEKQNNSHLLKKASKDEAIMSLTIGINTLSINYENRRQVFVEGHRDVTYYEAIYEKLRPKLIPDISMSFISSGSKGSGSSDQVKDIVKKLTQAGNKTISGIIDWDTSNKSDAIVKVLGEGCRYSIENFIFDPIILAYFLLREGLINPALLSLNNIDNHLLIKQLDTNQLQTLISALLEKIRPNLDNEKTRDISTQAITYICNKTAAIPKWYLLCPGHELERAIVKTFPELNRFKDKIKEEIIKKVITLDNMHEFLDITFLDVFMKIQE